MGSAPVLLGHRTEPFFIHIADPGQTGAGRLVDGHAVVLPHTQSNHTETDVGHYSFPPHGDWHT